MSHWADRDPDKPWNEEESAEVAAWLDTEPGMLQRLERRRATLQRMVLLKAPEIILDNQRRLVAELEEKLRAGGTEI